MLLSFTVINSYSHNYLLYFVSRSPLRDYLLVVSRTNRLPILQLLLELILITFPLIF